MTHYHEMTNEAQELYLCATNDGDFYRQSVQPVLVNLAKHYSKGFDRELAVRPFIRLAKQYVAKYLKEYGSPNDVISHIFTTKDQEQCAWNMLDHYMEEIVIKSLAGAK